MTTSHHLSGEDNIARLNAFLDQFPGGIDPEFDEATDELERQFDDLRPAFNPQ